MIINNTTAVSKIPANATLQRLYDDLQANILKSHARDNVKLLFLKFSDDPEIIKRWIKENLLKSITSFTEQLTATNTMKLVRVSEDNGICTFSLSAKGYRFLDIDTTHKDASFQAGMGNGTVPADVPKEDWEIAYNDDIHAVLIIAHTENGKLPTLVNSIKAKFPSNITVIAEEAGKALPGEKEHFGFADGRSQPRFFIEDFQKEPSTANWDPFASLSLALEKDPLGRAFNGGFTEDGDEVGDGTLLTHSYGSYLVFRKLEQDVQGWNNAVVAGASHLEITPQLFGAYAVGRFQDGTPVTMHDAPTGTITAIIENDFNYDKDGSGLKCPYHAHIRKSNPRGDSIALGATLEQEKARRIARRAIPYESEGKKGLLFMCYQSSIVDQFEFMQNAWIDNDNFAKPATGEDSTIGQGSISTKDWPTKWGSGPMKSFRFDHFVHLKGGEYFFTPPISFLKTF